MGAGKYDQRVTHLRQVITRDAIGGEVIDWEPVGTYWGAVRTFVAAERFVAGGEQQQAKSVIQVQIRYRDGVSVTDRLRWRDQILEITSVEDRDAKKWELSLMCETVLT